MRRVITFMVSFIATVIWAAQAWASINCPNEPAGSIVLANCNFIDITCGGNLTHFGGTAPVAKTFTTPAPPLAPANVLEMVRADPSGAGVNGTIYTKSGLINQTQLFGCMWFRAHIDGNPNLSNKFVFAKTTTMPDLFGLVGQPFSNNFQMIWDTNSVVNQCHIAPNCKTLAPPPSVCRVQNDGWYRLQFYMKTGVSSTSQDGTVRWWLMKDGQPQEECGHYTTVNLPGPLINVQFDQTWYAWSQSSWPTFDQTGPWYYWINNLYISKPTTVGSDSTAPATPSGLSVAPN